jgi:hypothetical protein
MTERRRPIPPKEAKMTIFATEMGPDPAQNDEGARLVTEQTRRFSQAEIAFLTGVPLLWGILLLFHPRGEGDEIYLELRDEVTPWLVVHLGMMLFIPLMAASVYLLVRGVEGTAARVSRIALVPFVVFYSAFETLQGTANGILVHNVDGLPQTDRAMGADLVQDFAESPLVRDLGVFSSLGALGLITALTAAGYALRRHAGAPLSVAVLLGLSGFLITAHPPPFGPTGLALFIAAALLFVRSRPRARARGALGQPDSA